jgi:hypothetical protein
MLAVVTTLAVGFTDQASAGGYVEARAGYVADSINSSESIGAAVGFEVDVGSGTTLGAEYVYDSLPSYSASFGGVNVRAGTEVAEGRQLFVTVGRVWPFYSYGYSYVGGIGYQADISQNAYVSVQAQHIFDSEISRAMVGIGLKF